MQLSPLKQRFVLHFGEMGSRWGINRTVGQIYALLYAAREPINADEIAESLGFSRSNMSIGLKELESWKLVRLSHKPGDRREYFRPLTTSGPSSARWRKNAASGRSTPRFRCCAT